MKNKKQDLLDHYDDLPDDVKNILSSIEDENYPECYRVKNELNSIGYDIEYDLSATLFNLKKL